MQIGRVHFKIPLLMLMAIVATAPLACAQDNMREAPYHGYTGQTFDTRAYAYDYLVDANLPENEPAQKKFKTLQAAYAAAPAGTPGHPTVIGIKPGVYFLRGTETAPGMTITKNYITLLGLTNNRRNVVLADDRGNKEGATNNGMVMVVNANGFTMMNLTLVNYCNLNYDYPGDPAKDLKMRSPVVTQAVALVTKGDKQVFSHVAFLSRLDTLWVQSTRSYFTNVFVEGTDDFIGGGPVGVWNDSEVVFRTANGVMSASGMTFINTVFKASHGMAFYKAIWNPVTLIHCVLPVNTPQSPVAWMVWKAPVRRNVYSLTYKDTDAKGNPAVIYDSLEGPHRFTLSRELTPQEMKAFNPWNLLRATASGTVDNWDPAHVRAKYASEGSQVFRMRLKASVPGASARPKTAATLGPFFSGQAPGNATIQTGSAGATLTATVLPLRAANARITWSTTSKLVRLSATTGRSIVVTASNTTDRAQYVNVRATAPDGLYATSHIYVKPRYTAPPTFARKPSLEPPADGRIGLSYALNLGKYVDQSIIDWYVCAHANCATRREVAVSRGNQPLRQLTLTPGDIGKYIEAGIRPRHNISNPGPETFVTSAKPIAASEIESSTINPDFRNFVTTESTNYVNGYWTLLGKWTSWTGDSLVNGYGIRIASRHAELLYQWNKPTGNMRVQVVMTPEKKAGQGFAIAGSPSDLAGPKNDKADIFIKYDPLTRNGYSLRFWRTIRSDKKCMFQLYKIVNGVGHPVNSQQELTGVFKPNTVITLSIIGNTFTATGSDTADGDTLSLKATIVPNTYGGAGLSWSGTALFGSSDVISKFKISYPKAAQ